MKLAQIGARYYPFETFSCAFNTVILERMEAMLPQGIGLRSALAALRGLMTPAVAARIRLEALDRVIAASAGLEVPGPEDDVVARFRPVGRPVEKRTDPALEKLSDPGYIASPASEGSNG